MKKAFYVPDPYIIPAKGQLADADKVICNTTMEEIKAVDTGEITPITNLPTPAKWISVKERLPEENELVLIYQPTAGNWVSSYDKHGWGMWENGLTCEPTH